MQLLRWKRTVTVNNCRVVIFRGNLLKVILKSTEAFFLISPEADLRSAEGGIKKKAEVDYDKTWRRLPSQIAISKSHAWSTNDIVTGTFAACSQWSILKFPANVLKSTLNSMQCQRWF